MKFQYKTIKYEGKGLGSYDIKTVDLEKELNVLGAAGWELAATLHPTTTSSVNILIFKRRQEG
jgi:hypothetical protein